MNEQTEQNRLKTYLRLISYLKTLKLPFFISILGFMVFASSQPMLAKFFEMVISALENQDAAARYALPLMAIGIYVYRGFGSYLGNYYNEFVGASVVRQLQSEIFQHLTVLPSEYYDTTNDGQVLHQLNSATGLVKKTVTDALKVILREGLTVIFLLAYAFYLNWKLSVIFLILAPIMAAVVSYASRRFRTIAKRNEDALGDVMQVSKEMISNYSVVKAFGAQDYEQQRFDSALKKAFKNQLKIRKISSIFTPVTQLIVATALAGIVFMLLSPTVLAENDTAQLIGYLTAIALLPKSFRQLSTVNIVIQQGIVGGQIVFNLLDTDPEFDDGDIEVESINGEIEVNNLSFTYPNSEEQVLKDISFSIKPGEMVALVGKSGSGKSTLAGLLTRSYTVDSKTIMIDGTDINDYKLENLRKHISVVNQNVSLFNDTIRKNIAYGDTEYTDEEIIEALKLSHALEFVETQSDGLDTVIGDDGLLLSGGQRQRLSIARAFLKRSPVLILDEATSALDNESENMIKKATEDLSKQRTTIVIAHRLSTIEKADRLLVVDEGKIVESGSHDELINRNGYYAKLIQSEFQE